MVKAVAIAIVATHLMLPLTPVFDCTNPIVARTYPMQCPTASDPLITGGGSGHGNGRGLIGEILHAIGLGGLL